jgi:hypothetical protein
VYFSRRHLDSIPNPHASFSRAERRKQINKYKLNNKPKATNRAHLLQRRTFLQYAQPDVISTCPDSNIRNLQKKYDKPP